LREKERDDGAKGAEAPGNAKKCRVGHANGDIIFKVFTGLLFNGEHGKILP